MVLFQAKNVRVEAVAENVAAIVLDAERSRTNLLTAAFVADLDGALDCVAGDARFHLLVLCSAKPASFCHGLDPHWLAECMSGDAMAALAQRGQQLCAKLADLAIPTVAVVAGTCLGAGMELALACDYRAVVNRSTIVLGLTAVELGLVPCWGGTQRLPRLVGLENSIRLLSGGRRLRPAEAFAIGLADTLSAEHDATPPAFLTEPVKRDWSQRPNSTWRQRVLEPHGWGQWLIFRGARRVLRERLPQDMPAPWLALDLLQHSLRDREPAEGLEYETQAAACLAESAAFPNLLHLRLERERRRASAPKPDAARFLRSIGIVGARPEAVALAQHALLRGCQVVMHEEDKAALGYASLDLHRGLLQNEVKRGTLTPAAALKCLTAFRGTADWQHFGQLDLVLDTRDDAQRLARFRHLDTLTAPATILASIGVTHMAAQLREGLRHPRRVAVLHFGGSSAQAALAELAHADDAAPPVITRLQEWVASLGKVCVTVADRPGLLVLRVWLPAFNEAALLMQEGMRPERIDEAMTRFGTVQAPLEWMDRLGLDAVARLIGVLQPVFGDRLALEPGFAAMAGQGMLGVRSGAGFFRHGGRRRRPNPRATAHWYAGPGEAWLTRAGLSRADQLDLAQRRMTALMVLEAHHCLRERLVDEAETLDFALATSGWAPHRGGPLCYARQLGADAFIARLEELARDFGPRFTPPPGLREVLAAVPRTS